jgi:predicted Zn-dependent peptidase
MGVSHFLEHMAFKRTASMTSEEIDRAFEEMGADHNAATGREMTFYWARVLGENVPRALEILSELIHPVLDAADFDQERQVILEEIARAEDQPTHVLYGRFLTNYFRDHPLALETLGTVESIQALTVQHMREYWRQRYGTSNITFAIAGNFDWDGVVDQVRDASRHWEKGQGGRPAAQVEFQPGVHVYRRDQFAQEQIVLGTPLVSRSDPRYYAAAVLATVLGDDRGSRLFWSLYQTGLAETVTAEVLEFEDNGLMLVHIGTEPELVGDALHAARAELERLQRFDVDENELERAKTKLTSSVIIGGESTNERVMGLINSWLTYGRLETLEEVREKIESVTLSDLRELVRAFPLCPDQVVTAVGPMTEEEIRAALAA